MNHHKSTWRVRRACKAIFVTQYVSDMLKKWDLIEDKLQEMLQWCLEYKAMTKNITAMKDELKKLKDVDSIKRKHLKSKQGLDKCKVSIILKVIKHD